MVSHNLHIFLLQFFCYLATRFSCLSFCYESIAKFNRKPMYKTLLWGLSPKDCVTFCSLKANPMDPLQLLAQSQRPKKMELTTPAQESASSGLYLYFCIPPKRNAYKPGIKLRLFAVGCKPHIFF